MLQRKGQQLRFILRLGLWFAARMDSLEEVLKRFTLSGKEQEGVCLEDAELSASRGMQAEFDRESVR